MEMRYFSMVNRSRCESPQGFNHTLDSWSLSDWMTATVGELGEAANVAKKLNRVRDGIPGNDHSENELREMLSDELADAFIYLDLMCQSQGITLEEAVQSKFNRTSRKIGYAATLHDEQRNVASGGQVDLNSLCDEAAHAAVKTDGSVNAAIRSVVGPVVRELEAQIAHAHEWYSARWKRLRELIHEESPDIEDRAINVMANGSADTMESVTRR